MINPKEKKPHIRGVFCLWDDGYIWEWDFKRRRYLLSSYFYYYLLAVHQIKGVILKMI